MFLLCIFWKEARYANQSRAVIGNHGKSHKIIQEEDERMEKIKFNTGQELSLLIGGVIEGNRNLTLKVCRGENTLSGIESMLSKAATQKITILSESGEDLQIFSGYTDLKSIKLDKNVQIAEGNTEDVIVLVLEKPDENAMRLESVEAQLTDAQLALCELYELIS